MNSLIAGDGGMEGGTVQDWAHTTRAGMLFPSSYGRALYCTEPTWTAGIMVGQRKLFCRKPSDHMYPPEHGPCLLLATFVVT